MTEELQRHLQNIKIAVRAFRGTAEEHEALANSLKVLEEALKQQ